MSSLKCRTVTIKWTHKPKPNTFKNSGKLQLNIGLHAFSSVRIDMLSAQQEQKIFQHISMPQSGFLFA